MLALLGSLPVIGNIITAITTAFFNSKVELTKARLGVDRDVAVSIVKAAAQQEHENTTRLGVFASNKILVFLLIGFALPLMAFEWKVIVWDKLLSWGSTDPISGQVANWGNTIIYFLFGSPVVMSLGKLWFGRDKTGE